MDSPLPRQNEKNSNANQKSFWETKNPRPHSSGGSGGHHEKGLLEQFIEEGHLM